MSCNCTDLNSLVNTSNSIMGGCYPTPTFSSGGSYAGVLLTGSTFTVGSITSSVFSGGSITGSSVTGLPTPTLASDAVTKSYADALAYQGPDLHSAVVAATTANITLGGSAPSTLDGKALALNNRILVKDQADNRQNGIYYVSTLGTGANGTWTRAADADATGELKVGAQTYVQYGTTNGGSLWVMSNTSVPTIGTDAINFTAAYTFVALPAAKVTGQLVDAQIADLAGSKLTGTLALPYDLGSGYNRVRTLASFGIKVGEIISLGQNGTNTGSSLYVDGNGHSLEINAVKTVVTPVVLTMKNTAGTTSIVLSSNGNATLTGNVEAAGAITSTTGDIVTTLGDFVSPAGGMNVFGLASAGQVIASGTIDAGATITSDTGDINATVGNISAGDKVTVGSSLHVTGKTITAGETTGAQTINAASGSVNFAAGPTSLVVTNSLVNANSIIMTSLGTADATARLGSVVAGAGSFTINLTAAATDVTRVNFLVTN